MSIDELGDKYMQLRSALATAYQEPTWDSLRIDRLTDEISTTEHAIAASGAGFAVLRPASGPVSAQAAGSGLVQVRRTKELV